MRRSAVLVLTMLLISACGGAVNSERVATSSPPATVAGTSPGQTGQNGSTVPPGALGTVPPCHDLPELAAPEDWYGDEPDGLANDLSGPRGEGVGRRPARFPGRLDRQRALRVDHGSLHRRRRGGPAGGAGARVPRRRGGRGGGADDPRPPHNAPGAAPTDWWRSPGCRSAGPASTLPGGSSGSTATPPTSASPPYWRPWPASASASTTPGSPRRRGRNPRPGTTGACSARGWSARRIAPGSPPQTISIPTCGNGPGCPHRCRPSTSSPRSWCGSGRCTARAVRFGSTTSPSSPMGTPPSSTPSRWFQEAPAPAPTTPTPMPTWSPWSGTGSRPGRSSCNSVPTIHRRAPTGTHRRRRRPVRPRRRQRLRLSRRGRRRAG